MDKILVLSPMHTTLTKLHIFITYTNKTQKYRVHKEPGSHNNKTWKFEHNTKKSATEYFNKLTLRSKGLLGRLTFT